MRTAGRIRGRREVALTALASLLLVLSITGWYVERAVFDAEQVAARAQTALRDDSVRTVVAREVVDGVVLGRNPDLLAARPLLEDVAKRVVGGDAFVGLFGFAVRDAHRALFAGDEDAVVLTMADAATVLSEAVRRLRPDLARDLAESGRVEVLRRDLDDVGAGFARTARDLRWLALVLGLLALALGTAVVVRSADRRRAVVRLATGVAVAGAFLVATLGVGRALVLGDLDVPEHEAAAGAVWDAFLGDLRTIGWLMAGCGVVVAAAAASYLRPVDLAAPLGRAGAWVLTEPETTGMRWVRAVTLVAGGLLVVLAGDAVFALLWTVLGVALLYAGVTAILRLTYRERETGGAPAAAPGPRPARRWRGPAVAAVLIVAALAIFAGSDPITEPARTVGTCNGHAELCDRTLDEVALAATHNSMSVPLPGWFSPEHERPIADQLADGIRGLLIDTHYADRLSGGRLRTDLNDRIAALDEDLSPASVQAAKRIRARIGGDEEGERGIYLCHGFCELGGTRLDEVLRDLRAFLVSRPDAVVVVVNQDEIPPEAFVGAVREAGLEEFAFTPRADGTWPTLGSMVRSGRRLVLLAEHRAGAAPWYQPVYERLVQETPFMFSSAAPLLPGADLEKSCAPNRGVASARLFLLNHWVTTTPVPRPSDARRVNARAAILARARTCEEVRDRLANLVAVNFYRRGDLLEAVDELNGVG